jgi:hypothetical protein
MNYSLEKITVMLTVYRGGGPIDGPGNKHNIEDHTVLMSSALIPSPAICQLTMVTVSLFSLCGR